MYLDRYETLANAAFQLRHMARNHRPSMYLADLVGTKIAALRVFLQGFRAIHKNLVELFTAKRSYFDTWQTALTVFETPHQNERRRCPQNMYLHRIRSGRHNQYEKILLRVSWREGRRVRNATIANCTYWPTAIHQALRDALADCRKSKGTSKHDDAVRRLLSLLLSQGVHPWAIAWEGRTQNLRYLRTNH